MKSCSRVILLTLLLLVTVFGFPWGCAKSPQQSPSSEMCRSNLTQVWRLLMQWVGEGDTFPPSLARLAEVTTKSNLFVCPNTGSRPGTMANVEEWTDYIYIGNQLEVSVLYGANLICPPENHGGTHGHVVWNGGNVDTLDAAQIRSLISDPWRAAKNPPDLIDHFRTNAIIRIPKKFQPLYLISSTNRKE